MASEEIVSYVLRYGGNCRDCADADGICPNTDMPCSFELKTAVIKHTLKALEYGISHGFIADPFTRAAPAATDTGLVTVAWQHQDYDEWHETRVPEYHKNRGKNVRALVTRSQAEELLAAEIRRERDLAEKQLSEVVDRMSDDYLALKADNAALTARVKELEGINANLMGDDEDKPRYTTKRLKHEIARATEALEAKLAAAQEALEPFADHAKERAVDAQEWRDTDTVKIVVTIADLRAARAVLGGKPS